ncbi:MAG TPA: hypothetical protein VND23_12175 [Acidimicrobiales bacterium]|nr:hypothetical protein [Acidimicrobiales bacterium]
MRRRNAWLASVAPITLVAGGLGLAGTVAVPSLAGATAVAPTCPVSSSASASVTCTYVATVEPDGSVSIASGGGATFGNEDVTVGVVNDSDGVLQSITLSGAGSFAFGHDGFCETAGEPAGCPFGPTGYEGPGTSFSGIAAGNGSGTVTFAGGMLPNATSYFGLEAAPSTAAAAATATITPGVSVSAPAISAVEGVPFDGQVTTFTDTGSTSAASDFSATIYWGDGTSSPGTVSGGAGAYAVAGTHTYADEQSDPDATVLVQGVPLASNRATSVDGTASVTEAPVTASPVAVGPQTTGQAFTVPVATFSDPTAGALLSEYSATISWGDGSSSPGVITYAGGTYTVAGTHTYATHGTDALSVTIGDESGTATTVADPPLSVADSVTQCTGGACTNTLTTSTLTSDASTTTPGPGDLLFSSDPNAASTALSCGDPFRHAPRVVTETDTFAPGSGTITATDTFPAAAGTPGSRFGRHFFWVCFQSNVPFRDLYGRTTTTGLLPLCDPFRRPDRTGPCVDVIYENFQRDIVERITYPVGDPRYG